MDKREVSFLLGVSNVELKTLWSGKSVNGMKFVEKYLESRDGGFYTDIIIFKKDDSYYKFYAFSYYLDDCFTFSEVFEVFPETVTYVKTIYKNWKEDVI